ncbi:MAG: DUF1566 domain-containing protein [Nitrospirota bacterium]
MKQKRGYSRYLLAMLLLLTIAITASCGGGGGGGDGGGGAPSEGGGSGGATLSSINVIPANSYMYRNGTMQITAYGTYSDGTTQDITTSVSWSPFLTNLVTISNTGLVTANANNSGTVYIVARSGNISGSAQFMVSVDLPKTGQMTCRESGVDIACPSTGQDGELQKGVAWPSPRFTVSDCGTLGDPSDDVVTDNLTGLMWARTPDSITRSWQEALDYANSFSLCGYTVWRLPNRKELRSLINYGAVTYVWLNTQGFSNVRGFSDTINSQEAYYWSSSTYALDARYAWTVGMYINVSSYSFKSGPGDFNYAWPVRGGW